MASCADENNSIRYRVTGMDCASCSIKIENALKRVDGVVSSQINIATGDVIVHGNFDQDVARQAIIRLGFEARIRDDQKISPLDDHHGHDHMEDDKKWWQTNKGRLVIVSFILTASAFLLRIFMPHLGQWPFIVAALFSLYPVAKHALAAARSGSIFTIEMLMTIAALGALAINAAEEAAVVVLLFAIGEVLEGVATSRARKTIAALGDLTPKTALLMDGDELRDVPVESLLPGQIILVRAGSRIPCDGMIIEGVSEIDEAPVTGESVPVVKEKDAIVFAGTINILANLTVRVTRAAADNTIARIIRLVEEAQMAQAPVQRFIDKFARIYMPVIVMIAILVAVMPPLIIGAPWGVWIYRALALLLIACPCALVISTPAAIAAGMASGARRGLLIKGGVVLESLGALKTICFDKTGTLTQGRPQVTDMQGITLSDDKVLHLVAALEKGSSHPIAKAVLAFAAERKISPALASDVVALAGKGLRGKIDGQEVCLLSPRAAMDVVTISDTVLRDIEYMQSLGKTVAVLIVGGAVCGLFAVRDTPREDARLMIRELSRRAIRSVMLTGDNRHTAQMIAQDLGIEMHAELMPEDKARIIRELDQSGYGPVGKVGDGINDAPALAAARVGIAMGSGTDIALETADAALLGNNLDGVVDLVDLSRATLANIHMNIMIALGSKAVFLVTTILGITGMWIAVLADTGATVLVTLNALRLLGIKAKKKSDRQ